MIIENGHTKAVENGSGGEDNIDTYTTLGEHDFDLWRKIDYVQKSIFKQSRFWKSIFSVLVEKSIDLEH